MTSPLRKEDSPELRARLAEMAQTRETWEARAAAATAAGGHALARLLALAETRNSGQIRYVAQFIACSFNGRVFPLDLYDLRSLDVEIGDDMIACIDAIRWGRTDIHKLVPDGEARILAVLEMWGIKWPESD